MAIARAETTTTLMDCHPGGWDQRPCFSKGKMAQRTPLEVVLEVSAATAFLYGRERQCVHG